MFNFRYFILFAMVLLTDSIQAQRLNQTQIIGSHNSYKILALGLQIETSILKVPSDY